MKNKILFLLFIFLALGFLLFKINFVQAAEDGTCFCSGGGVTMETDYSKDECETDEQCKWSENKPTGACKCDVIENEQTIDQVEYSSFQEECLSKAEGGKEYVCVWEAKVGSSSQSASDGGTSAAIDLPSVEGLKQLSIPGSGAKSVVKNLFGNIINVAMGLLGSVALALFAYAGVLWMLSGGNSEQATKARNIAAWAVLGLFVIFASYTIVSFIFSAVEK